MNFNQVTVPSLDIPTAIAFYKILGLELIVKALPHYARFVCPNGNTPFSIHLAEELSKVEGIYVYSECEDVDNRIDELITKGLQFDELPNNIPWLRREARLKNPHGNRIILYFTGENRLNPPWRIKD